MEHLITKVPEAPEPADLRLRIMQLRQELAETTDAYRRATAQHDSTQSIGLLRSRSRLMRDLLDAQCKLLLSLRSAPVTSECRAAQAP